MKRLVASVWLAWAALTASSACNVDETHLRCKSDNECVTGEECYLGFCVQQEPRDAATGERRDTAAISDAGVRRRRPTPTLTGRSQEAGTGERVGMSTSADSSGCTRSEEDAGATEGACCERATACYDGPDKTRGVGRCKDGQRACEDGKLGACEGSVQPRSETCDNQGSDDDCDGQLDNVPDRGNECMLPASAQACGKGVLACEAGKKGLQCVIAMAPPELCNAKDDDCDSKVDEGFDLKKDAMNCGACGTRCSNAQLCCGGACAPRVMSADGCPECSATQPCAAGRTCCGGLCVDVQTTREHCGACGNTCPARQACCAGTCVDTRVDEKNCGACGTACTQGTSLTCCSGSCVDINVDRRNCGACGNNCGVVCTCELNNGQPECGGFALCF